MQGSELERLGIHPMGGGLHEALGGGISPGGLLAALRGIHKPRKPELPDRENPDIFVRENQEAGGNNVSRA